MPHIFLSETEEGKNPFVAAPIPGDTIYCNPAKTWEILHGNGSATRKFLTQRGGSGIPLAPVWDDENKVVSLADVGSPALDASLGKVFLLVATGNRIIAVPTNPTTGQTIIIVHTASGGARTLSLNTSPGGFRFGSDITGLTETVSGKSDYVGLIYNAAASFWDVLSFVKGF